MRRAGGRGCGALAFRDRRKRTERRELRPESPLVGRALERMRLYEHHQQLARNLLRLRSRVESRARFCDAKVGYRSCPSEGDRARVVQREALGQDERPTGVAAACCRSSDGGQHGPLGIQAGPSLQDRRRRHVPPDLRASCGQGDPTRCGRWPRDSTRPGGHRKRVLRLRAWPRLRAVALIGILAGQVGLAIGLAYSAHT